MIYTPSDTAEIAGIVRAAAAAGETLEILGGGSKRGLGRPMQAQSSLILAKLAGVTDYQPSELVLTAQAGTALETIEVMLQAQNQMLAFEPPNWCGLLGDGGTPTLGGTIACNLAGPRRVRAGAARDHFLGFIAVNGFGEIWKAGGKVVKNVTGYDLCKLMAGAYGTLSVMTEITVKVLPRPETQSSLILPGLTLEAAVVAMATALNSPHEVSAAAYLPEAAAGRLGHQTTLTLLRLEGPVPSVAYRAAALRGDLPGEIVQAEESTVIWSAIADVATLIPAGMTLWRLCPPPSAAARLVARLREPELVLEWFMDWGGGLVWLTVPPEVPNAGADTIRAALADLGGGTATLIRADAGLREKIPVFEPAPRALTALSARVKTAFDPFRVLNPGRMQEAG